MRSSVSYILSHAPGESVMSHPDYSQHAQHHACLLVLVKGIGGMLKNFNKLWERIQRVNNIKVTDSTGQVRDIWVRYVRDYPVENNDWGDFQTHRRLLGLITLSKFTNQVELNEVCRVHESLKVKYTNTLYDSRAFMFGPISNMKRPEQEAETYSYYEEDRPLKDGHFSDKESIPSEHLDSMSSSESFPHSVSSSSSFPQEQHFTTPSNFKTQAMFYGENDVIPDLEQQIADWIESLFWVVESKRMERSKEKLDKVSLLLAPFEKKDFVGLDMESRNNKKRCMGRVTKNLADLTLQAGLVADSLSLYNSSAEMLKTDWLWLAAAKEGLCTASAILLYPNLRNPTPLHRNASLQENSPNKTKQLSLFQPSDPFRKYKVTSSPLRTSKTSSPVNPPSDHTPTSSDSMEISSRQSETDNADSESLASSSDIEYQSHKSFLSSDFPSIPRQSQSQINNQYLLNGEEIAEKYREAIMDYSKYKNAGVIETEACFKAARIAVEQNNSLHASSFLQNVIYINLTLSEQEKIQRFETLAELYKEIGFHRKAGFCQRLAAARQVSPNNPSPDWQKCYYLMLHSFPGYKLSLDPNYVMQHQVGWPALQIQILKELVQASRRMGHPALATRHTTFLLQTMWPHLSRQEQRDFAIQLQSNMDNALQSKVFQYSNEDIQNQLPVPPNETATIAIKLYGEADFLDLGGIGGENLFPNSLTSNYPSRVGSPVPNAQTSLPTQSSNQQTSLSSGLIANRTSGSFRSTNSHTTSWSAPISVMSPSRGRQIETQLMIRYSGGEGKSMHCRQSTLQINLELLPSVSITHWDVLPAEIPSQLYLVLDVTNLTAEEMDFHYAPQKHILIESKESCRVPVPLDRCPFNTTPNKTADEDQMEAKSTNTGSSTNSLEMMCSEHITNNTSLNWTLMQSNISGRASVKGITLSQAMMDIVRMSPLNWEVSVNSQCIKPQEEYNCSAGECLSLGVAVWNHLSRPLHKLCLSVQFYQDYNNGVLSYKLDNRVATAGNNKVVLTTLPEAAKAYHECTVVFLTPGEYKIDIQCSTTEPILDEVPLIKETDHPSIIQPCAGEVSHVWRFIPPVAISVTD